MNYQKSFWKIKWGKIIFITMIAMIGLFSGYLSGAAQSVEQTQKFNGNIPLRGGVQSYTLSNLELGRKLYVHVQGTSGNLDPFVALIRSDQSDKRIQIP